MSKHVNKAGGDTLPKRSIFRPKRKVVKISLDTSRNELTIRRICRLGDKVHRQEPHNFQSDKMSFSKEFCPFAEFFVDLATEKKWSENKSSHEIDKN